MKRKIRVLLLVLLPVLATFILWKSGIILKKEETKKETKEVVKQNTPLFEIEIVETDYPLDIDESERPSTKYTEAMTSKIFSKEDIKGLEIVKFRTKDNGISDNLTPYKVIPYEDFRRFGLEEINEAEFLGPFEVTFGNSVRLKGKDEKDKLEWIKLVLHHVDKHINIPEFPDSISFDFSINNENDTLYFAYTTKYFREEDGEGGYLIFNNENLTNIYRSKLLINTAPYRLVEHLRNTTNNPEAEHNWRSVIVNGMLGDFNQFVVRYRDYTIPNLYKPSAFWGSDLRIFEPESFMGRVVIKNNRIAKIDYSLGQEANSFTMFSKNRGKIDHDEHWLSKNPPLYYGKDLAMVSAEQRSNKQILLGEKANPNNEIFDIENITIVKPNSENEPDSLLVVQPKKQGIKIDPNLKSKHLKFKKPVSITGISDATVVNRLVNFLPQLDCALFNPCIPKSMFNDFRINRMRDTIFIIYGGHDGLCLDDMIFVSRNQVLDIMEVSGTMAYELNNNDKGEFVKRFEFSYPGFYHTLSDQDWQKKIVTAFRYNYDKMISSYIEWYYNLSNRKPTDGPGKSFVVKIEVENNEISEIYYSILHSPSLVNEWWDNRFRVYILSHFREQLKRDGIDESRYPICIYDGSVIDENPRLHYF